MTRPKIFKDTRGSSPQVRGRPCHGVPSCSLIGLIPAGAGQTVRSQLHPRGGRAHPRRCGADLIMHSQLDCSPGSSPQVRGRLRSDADALTSNGLIPAGAGQTCLILVCRRSRRAHPRRCGADSFVTPYEVRASGSSPQVRGRLTTGFPGCPSPGLIPAGAGQTGASPARRTARRAHPRRCGADDLRVGD